MNFVSKNLTSVCIIALVRNLVLFRKAVLERKHVAVRELSEMINTKVGQITLYLPGS